MNNEDDSKIIKVLSSTSRAIRDGSFKTSIKNKIKITYLINHYNSRLIDNKIPSIGLKFSEFSKEMIKEAQKEFELDGRIEVPLISNHPHTNIFI